MSVLALRDEHTQSKKDNFKKREKEKSHGLNLSMCPARFTWWEGFLKSVSADEFLRKEGKAPNDSSYFV